MSAHDHRFVTHWRIAGRAEEIYDVLADLEALARWWPSVHLAVRPLARGDESGVGRRVELDTKGWLPGTLRWRLRVIRAERPRTIAVEAAGDFVGRGEWTFSPDGPYVDARHDWRVRAEKPLLRLLSPALKPVFAANHGWAMHQGRLSLGLELRRRRAVTEWERNMVSPPPGPTFVARSRPRPAPDYAGERLPD